MFQINPKLNGTNHIISPKSNPFFMNDNVMLVGADVTHPEPGSNQPSVVGVAASYDKLCSLYGMRWDVEKYEIILNLKSIMIELLNDYKKHQSRMPKKIIYYRDGVGQGDYQKILNTELNAIYAACKTVAPQSVIPKVTVILVVKRHHLRMFPSDKGPSDERNCGNVLPGTIIDKDVFDTDLCQFGLVSHASPKGVAKPVRYCMIYDDSDIDIDDLQTLTHNLCHTFVRCDRSVSYVAPTYYAHHAALRGKTYIYGEPINFNKLNELSERIRVHPEILDKHPMRFV